MKWKGIELKEITEQQIFDPPKKMVVWNALCTEIKESVVAAIVKDAKGDTFAITHSNVYSDVFEHWVHCAEIPEALKPQRATWKELAYWLLDGHGLVMDKDTKRVDTGIFFDKENIDKEVGERWLVMRRDDTEWQEPTADYMRIEEADNE